MVNKFAEHSLDDVKIEKEETSPDEDFDANVCPCCGNWKIADHEVCDRCI